MVMLAVGDARSQRGDFVMRPFQELVDQPELAQQFEGRGMDGVAAEIAQEVGVLLQHLHLAPGPREQQPRHHPRGPTADDDEIEFRRHGVTKRTFASVTRCGRPA